MLHRSTFSRATQLGRAAAALTLLLAGLAALAPSVEAQLIGEKWARTYHGAGRTTETGAPASDVPRGIVADAAGNIVVGGISAGFWVGKFAGADGRLLWEKVTSTLGLASAIAVDSNGDVIATGFVAGPKNGGDYDIYTAKYRGSDGALIWEQKYNGAANSTDRAEALAIDKNGNVAIAGYTVVSAGTASTDYYTAKYAGTNGALIWEKKYNGLSNADDRAENIGVDADGNVIVAGSSDSPVTGGKSPKIYTIKYAAADGAKLWEQRLNYPADGADTLRGMVLDPSGNAVIVGKAGTEAVVKLAGSNGAVVWQRNLPSSVPFNFLLDVVTDAAGNVFATAQGFRREGPDDASDSSIYTAKYSGVNGATIWEQSFNTPATDTRDRGVAIAVDSGDNPVITGAINGGESNFRGYVAAYSGADGTLLWEQRVKEFNNSEIPVEITVTPDGSAVVTGQTLGNQQTSDDLFVAKYGRVTAVELGLWAAGRDLKSNEKPDRAAETSATNASTPEWSYGYRSAAAATDLTLFTAGQHYNAIDSEQIEGFGIPGSGPVIAVNVGTSAVVQNFGSGNHNPLLPEQLLINPASNGSVAVVRWTAPAAGHYSVVGRWFDLDPWGGDGVSCHMIVNGVERFGRNMANGGTTNLPLTRVNVQAGDVIDFVLGSRGDFNFDSTGFNVAIRRSAGVFITAPASAVEGQDVQVNVTTGGAVPVTVVELRNNGRFVARKTAPPFDFTVQLNSGTHMLQAVGFEAGGVEAASDRVRVTVTRAGESATARATKAGDQKSAPATAGTSYFFTRPSGNWTDPNSWTPNGVPGPSDDAFILGDGTNGSVVNIGTKHEVKSLSVGTGSKIINNSGAARFDVGIIVLGEAWLNDCELRGFELLIASGAKMTTLFNPALFDMTIVNNGETVYTGPGRTIGDASSKLINNGNSQTKRGPGSNAPAGLTIPLIEQNGGLLGIGDLTKIAAANVIAQGGSTLIGMDGASIIKGAGLVGPDGASLIGMDGASLIGPDGASLVGPDGASLIGPDGASLIGMDGASFAQAQSTGTKGEERERAAIVRGSFLFNGGTLGGTGNIIGDLINRGAFVTPGRSAGALRIFGSYTQENDGKLLLEVGGTSLDPLQHDQLQIIGPASFGGSLIVRSIDGISSAGMSLKPIIYESASGSFSSVTNANVSFDADGMNMQPLGQEPPAPKPLNIATRMRVETGDNVLIAGFIVTGSQPKRVLIRGVGPSLPVTGALADPTLDLDGGAFFNDDWRSDQQGEIEGTTIPPLNDREAAIVATLEPGAHTAVLRGKNNGTGVGLVEVYDLESGTPAQLANISTRGQVQTGDNVMIGGFIIAGSYPAKVLLRAIGPSLPVAGSLQDPTLELVDGNGATISNDNWRATQEAEIIATTVPPTNDREAAIVATLVPGAYTAVVRGKDDTVGVALVEGYNLQ